MRRAFLILTLGLPLVLAACSGGGADVESTTQVRSTTTGQELIDLQRALDSGVITQAQYDAEKTKILERK